MVTISKQSQAWLDCGPWGVLKYKELPKEQYTTVYNTFENSQWRTQGGGGSTEIRGKCGRSISHHQRRTSGQLKQKRRGYPPSKSIGRNTHIRSRRGRTSSPFVSYTSAFLDEHKKHNEIENAQVHRILSSPSPYGITSS